MEEVLSLEVAGRTVCVQVRRHPRRRRMSLLVNGNGQVELRLPKGLALRQAVGFVQGQKAWIGERLSVPRPPLADGVLLPFLGEYLVLRLSPEGASRVRRTGEALWVGGGLAEQLAATLERWYRRQAVAWLSQRVAFWCGRMEVAVGRVTVRSQKSRWGSCSTRGNINLNWRLLFFPPSVVDYVVIHELAHLHHPNHSPAFWLRVAVFCPDHVALRRQLRRVLPF